MSSPMKALILLALAVHLTAANLLPPSSGQTLSTEAKPSLDIPNIKGIQPGIRHYLKFAFTPAKTAPNARIICQLVCLDAQNKPVQPAPKPIFRTVSEPGKQQYLGVFTPPPKATTATLHIICQSMGNILLENLELSTKPTPAPDGNLMVNGSFETPNLMEYYIVHKHGKDTQGMTATRSALKARTGRYSLLCTSPYPNATNEINLNMLPFRPEAKYRLATDYFIASATGKIRVAGRVCFFDRDGKPIRYHFPEGDATPGKWHRLQLDFHPPVGTDRVTATLWLVGHMDIHLDNVYYGELQNQRISNRHAATRLLQDSPAFTLWKEAPYLKVQPQGHPQNMTRADAIQLDMAANESEPFQLVITPRQHLKNITLTCTDLKSDNGHAIPATQCSYRIVDYVNLKNPDNPSLKGLNADPLLPANPTNATPAQNLPLYVTVKASPNQPAGLYRGTLTLNADGQPPVTIPLTVRVRNFALPTIANLRTYMYAQPLRNRKDLDPRPWQVIADDMQRILHDHRMNGNQAQWTPRPTWTIQGDKLTITDWSRFDQVVNQWHHTYGMVNMPTPLFGMMGDNDGWWGKEDRNHLTYPSPFNKLSWQSPQALNFAGQFARQFTDYVKKKYPHINFYAYIYDEPPEKVHKDLARLTNALHQSAPDLKIFIPKQVTDKIGYVHTFCVPFTPGHFNAEKQAQVRQRGGDIWFYNWTVKLDNLDYLRTRFYTWQIYMADGNGGLLWNTINAPRGINPWNDFEKTASCGSATIFYPPRKPGDRLYASLRAAQIKEGIDDFDYMRILQRKIDRLYPHAELGTRRVKEVLNAIFTEPPFKFKNDPHLLYAIRTRLADEIEALDQAPQAVVVSNPPEHALTDLSLVTFQLYAPSGSTVTMDGKPAGTVTTAPLNLPCQLSKLGTQTISLTVSHQGKTMTLNRTFTLQEDPNLQELRKLVQKCTAQSMDIGDAQRFLKRISSGQAYTLADRQLAQKLVEDLKKAMVTAAMRKSDTFTHPLAQAMFKRAQDAVARKQYTRGNYYLKLAQDANASTQGPSSPVRLTAMDYKSHPAFLLENSQVAAIILETGGRLVSYKVNGIETMGDSTLDRILPLARRAAQHVTDDLLANLTGYGGYEDAGGGELWPVSFVDWNLDFLELKPNQTILAFSTRLPNTPFRFRRTMTLAENSRDLIMDIEITNTMPANQASDDPEHLQVPWRGRFVPAIGNGQQPEQNDCLMLKPARPDQKLVHNLFDVSRPLMYERRSIRLATPCLGAYDAQLKTGIAFLGDHNLTHAYVWFNTRGNAKGEGKVYTLEYPRSFYGKVSTDPDANKPFTIKPEQSQCFRIIVRGLTNITDDASFWQKALTP